MLKIRLQRIGRKHDPHFRVVVIDSKYGPKSNNFVEWIGVYNPKLGTKKIDGERATYWLGVGAQASVTVHNMLVSEKVIDAKKLNALPKKTPIVAEKEEEEAPKESAPAKEEEAKSEDAPATDTPAEDAPKEEAKEEKAEEAPAQEEAPKEEEKPAEEK